MTSWIEVDRERLLANARVFRDLLDSHRKLMAVVKADAYGHGLALVAPVIAKVADWYGVNDLEEALALHRMEPDKPILILGHSESSACETIVAHGFRQVLFRKDTAEALSSAASRLDETAYVHLKIETGLHRLGVPAEEMGAIGTYLTKLEGVVVEGAYTHFADIEDPGSRFYLEQLHRFDRALTSLAQVGIEPPLTHASPSAGVLLHDQGWLSLARVGLGLYGIWPSPATREKASATLQPALSWKCRIAQVRGVEAGAHVGYDLTYVAPSARRIAVLPVGYFEGVGRALSNRGFVLVRGRRAPIVGRVAMNMTMIDVTDADAREDDEVVLIGEQGDDAITAEDWAQWSDTIAYEVVTRLNGRIPRTLV